jgi:D-serine deaminase-like pyridoxal phosphate-dependent protein
VTQRYYTTSTAFLEALAEAGVTYVFANLGSDHPPLIEALAQARAEGRADALPKVIVCPHETVALSAAHAYAMVTGEPQAVAVHVDAGTQNLSGAVSNAMRGRVPVLVFAGLTPFTQEGELPGSRTEFITGSRMAGISAASCATTSSTTTRSVPEKTSSSSCTARCNSPAASRRDRYTWSARVR